MENEELEKLLPQINVSVPQQLQQQQEEKPSIVPPEMLLGLIS